jgi:Zn-dependent protease
MESVVDAVVWYFAFVFSVTLHEASHALAAMWGGDATAYEGGQVSLDPIPHMRRSPFGMILFPMITLAIAGWPMGFASAPYDPIWADRYPRRAAWMSLAGPAANLALVFLCGVLVWVGIAAGHFEQPQTANYHHIVSATSDGNWASAAFFLSVMLTMNLVLFLLNMIPLPPLDGAGALGLLLSDDGARRLREVASNGTFAMLGMLLVFYTFGKIFDPLFTVFLNLLYPGANFG